MNWKTLLHQPPAHKQLLTKVDLEGKQEIRTLIFDGQNWRDLENKIVQQPPTHWNDDK